MTQWYSFADTATGAFDGVQRRLPADQVAANTPAGMVAVVGEVDARRAHLVMAPDDFGDAVVPVVVAQPPARPADTEMTTWAWSEIADDWIETPTTARLARDARARRDELMLSADWVTLRALRTGTPVPPDWAAYLQALADVPQQPGFPTAIDWPKPPTP
ncbi:MAG: hypothetical protein EOP37_03190 [Rubrivivax sp.]|nr:MAG: hypothetical protein EOP37_03190 [Rubrivivax sp.]